MIILKQTLKASLTLAQIYLSKGNVSQCLMILLGLSEQMKYEPSFVSAICSLYLKNGESDKALQFLDESCQYWLQMLQQKSSSSAATADDDDDDATADPPPPADLIFFVFFLFFFCLF